MRKCIVLSDSFKGSLSSEEIGRIVKEECRRQFPACHVLAFSVADGGEQPSALNRQSAQNVCR